MRKLIDLVHLTEEQIFGEGEISALRPESPPEMQLRPPFTDEQRVSEFSEF